MYFQNITIKIGFLNFRSWFYLFFKEFRKQFNGLLYRCMGSKSDIFMMNVGEGINRKFGQVAYTPNETGYKNKVKISGLKCIMLVFPSFCIYTILTTTLVQR